LDEKPVLMGRVQGERVSGTSLSWVCSCTASNLTSSIFKRLIAARGKRWS